MAIRNIAGFVGCAEHPTTYLQKSTQKDHTKMPDNVLDFPTQDKDSNAGLAELQGTAERTRTISVMHRKVANENGTMTEVGVPTNVFIRPLPFRRWFFVLQHMERILANLPLGDLNLESNMQLGMWIAKAMASAPDNIIGIASLATDKPMEFFDEIDLDEGIQLMIAVVEVNKDFFVQKVLPLVSEKAPELKQAMATFGQTV